jgi:PIN domain nuclease of toxin-antitoxin system
VRAVLLDTHAWAWSLTGDARLRPAAVGVIEAAETVMVSPVSFFEIAQKVRLGKWPEMEPFLTELPARLDRQGGVQAVLDAAVCLTAGAMPWSHRDSFDRVLAATAQRLGCPIVSADPAFDGVVQRVW